MARHRFGGDLAGWAFTAGAGNIPTLATAVTVTFWSAATAGTQYTDLALNPDGSSPVTDVTTGATAGTEGAIPLFYGPAGVVAMWAAVGTAPRSLIVANDTGQPDHCFTLTVTGTLTVAAGTRRLYNDTGVTLTIQSVRASVGTAPTGAAIRVDVNKNGTTIFTTQTNRPTIAISGFTSGKVISQEVTGLADGDYLTCDVDVIGSTIAGADLVVQIFCAA